MLADAVSRSCGTGEAPRCTSDRVLIVGGSPNHVRRGDTNVRHSLTICNPVKGPNERARKSALHCFLHCRPIGQRPSVTLRGLASLLMPVVGLPSVRDFRNGSYRVGEQRGFITVTKDYRHCANRSVYSLNFIRWWAGRTRTSHRRYERTTGRPHNSLRHIRSSRKASSRRTNIARYRLHLGKP